MLRGWIILLVLPIATQAVAKVSPCASPLGAAVPDARTAIAIARAVIAGRPVKGKGYLLHVGRERDGWIASQSLPPAPTARNQEGHALETFGGGGIRMHIDRCTGEISDMYYLR